MHEPRAEHDAAHDPPATRIIVLGASNATRGLPVLFETARALLGPVIDMHAAIGHGRSFGAPSRAMFRRLPGILECALWSALEQSRLHQPGVRTVALITDIGNDIIYGRSASELLQWIAESLDRLMQLNAQPAITALPMVAIEQVPRWRATLVKWMTYPTQEMSVDTAIERARAVNTGVRELAAARHIPIIEPDPNWYFLDPIHIANAHWPQAATAMLAPLTGWRDDPSPGRIALLRRLHLHTAMPARFSIAGINFTLAQPIRRIECSTLSLY